MKTLSSLLIFIVIVSVLLPFAESGTFQIGKDNFELDGKPFLILSGSIHYFRIRPEQWVDRLTKLKAMGLNTVQTYVPWNTHNPHPGQYNFEGMLDLVKFLTLCQKMKIYVILRASPYICAEYDGGGVPSWLQNIPGVIYRSSETQFISNFNTFMDVLVPKVLKFQYNRYGGPIILLQLENEFGSYGTDFKYQTILQDSYTDRGMKDTPFFQSNNPREETVDTTTPGMLISLNYASEDDPKVHTDWYRNRFPGFPVFVSEWWDGWMEAWGQPKSHQNVQVEGVNLDWLISHNVSVNFYMFHGGTNFGFTSAKMITTSYDYNCALNESGDPTDKFVKFRQVIDKYYPVKEKMPVVAPKGQYGSISMTESLKIDWNDETLLNLIGCKNEETVFPMPMDHFGQTEGFILYKTTVTGPKTAKLEMNKIQDRVQVYRDGTYIASDTDKNPNWQIQISNATSDLQFFVENQGRVNSGPWLQSEAAKGILQQILFDQKIQFHWKSWSFNMNSTYVGSIPWKKGVVATENNPTFYRGTFFIKDRPLDTFISYGQWNKGVIWINGFNLGRYWHVGPQLTLYVPSSILKQGQNEIILLELIESPKSYSVTSVGWANLG